MDNTCTVTHGNIAVAGDIEGFFILLFANRLRTVEQGLIFFIFELTALIFL